MKNTFTATIPNMNTRTYETRELTYLQAVEVLRDILKVPTKRAKAILHYMEKEKLYTYGLNALRITKNK